MTHLTNEHRVAPINAAKGFSIHLLVFLLATPIIWLAWYLTDTSYPWILWQTPAWTIGLLFHYLGEFVFKKLDTIKYKTQE